ncbi:hypothetical protein JFU48_12830 [Pseudomonas sp. TH49]|uniref:hypothetical protein n=1 Tax=Pseudomonas sp. TH49 TaxID=2796413 RepID=UPI0019136E50|nr:hypothetical protein [Pseudomonas sp. TH49]MBK5342263.1 hypothetical protein [Pseudomonas sp. TH49]
MYPIILAELLDGLVAQADALVSEGEEHVVVSNLRAQATLQVLQLCNDLRWENNAVDEEQNATEISNIVEDFEPFKVFIRKPPGSDGDLRILTLSGLIAFLDKGHDATCWRIARLSKPITTQAHHLTDWSTPTSFTRTSETKSPRSIVKAVGISQAVPRDIRPWILTNASELDFTFPYHLAWSARAFQALIRAIPNEVESSNQSLIFKGPPKLVLQTTAVTAESIGRFGALAFIALQEAVAWSYENFRDVEIKHGLLATEIARSGRSDGLVEDYLKDNILTALESAKIAYQMSISDIAKDTLKSLTDLRKAITEDTAKTTDATRQTITAITGAFAVTIGLVAARLSSSINPWLILTVLVVALAYVGMIVYSGWSFIKLQRNLRADWQAKLYRFLPAVEYEKMVVVPAGIAESTFRTTAIVGGVAFVLMCVGVAIFGFTKESSTLSDRVESTDAKVVSTKINTITATKNFHSQMFMFPSHNAFRAIWLSPLAVRKGDIWYPTGSSIESESSLTK